MTVDAAVFLFGVLVCTLVGAGILMLFYGSAFVDEAKRQKSR